MYVFCVLLILACASSVLTTNEDGSTLQQVHIFFRHGDRTTDTSTIYPKDPYSNVQYYPYGRGELTKKGKQTAYKLGKMLRSRYDHFLGPTYTPSLIDARTSPYNRTMNSLQLVLAGLFPPSEDEIFESGLNWQPIPYYHEPKPIDKIFLAIDNCPNFQKYLDQYTESPKIAEDLKAYSSIFDYISRNTGQKMNNYFDVLLINAGLKTEKEWGLTLPKWTRKVYPRVLEIISIKSFGLLTGTTELRRLTSGYFLKKIVDDCTGKIQGTLVPENRKIFLYSGHEFNIGFLLNTLDIFKKHVPPYGAHIMFELHKINGIYGLKIFYQDYSAEEPQLLKLPACEEFCPMDQFAALVEENFPQSDTCGNEKICDF